jgi:hypothetical protein
MTELDEFKAWMKLNRRKFLTECTDPHEVAYYAKLNGFSDEVVYPHLSHFETALRDGNIKNALRTEESRFNSALHLIDKKFCFDEQWLYVRKYQVLGIEWEGSNEH